MATEDGYGASLFRIFCNALGMWIFIRENLALACKCIFHKLLLVDSKYLVFRYKREKTSFSIVQQALESSSAFFCRKFGDGQLMTVRGKVCWAEKVWCAILFAFINILGCSLSGHSVHWHIRVGRLRGLLIHACGPLVNWDWERVRMHRTEVCRLCFIVVIELYSSS